MHVHDGTSLEWVYSSCSLTASHALNSALEKLSVTVDLLKADSERRGVHDGLGARHSDLSFLLDVEEGFHPCRSLNVHRI